jgi:hypothetical protein
MEFASGDQGSALVMADSLPGQPLVWRPKGVSDAIDGTNAFPGAMASLSNLIPSPTTAQQWVPRPASIQATDFTGFSTPAQIEALLVLGNIAYGMIASAAFSGKSQPFAYNILTNAFLTITGQASANLPASASSSGDWVPPIMAVIGTRVMVTHPGFSGTNKIGWIDFSGFTSATITGSTHTNTTLDTLSSNPISAGWKPGMTVSSSAGDIPAGTTIVSLTATAVVLSAAATGTNAGSTITVTGGTAASPQWGAGNTNTNVLSAVPVAVANFNGRAYYAVPGAGAQFSDSGNPTQITNATQAVSAQNGLDITAFGALPISQLTGGALQSLFAFQGDAQIQQITGDPVTSNLAINALPFGVGCLAPNTICNTTMGLAFVAPDGLRVITFSGQVTDPVGANGKGVNQAFLSALTPSRMCAAFNQNVLRISVTNGAVTGQPVQEWWLDFSLKVWSGPHTFPAALIEPYQAPSGVNAGHGFLMMASGINAKLWTSAVNLSLSSTFTENGTALSWVAETSLLPDNMGMDMNSMVQTAVGFSLPSSQSVAILAMSDTGSLLNQITLQGSGGTSTIWNAFVWGAANWTAVTGLYQQYRLPWTTNLVFKQIQLAFSGSSTANFAIGNIYLRFEKLNYILPP